jgi:hypothetical protein
VTFSFRDRIRFLTYHKFLILLLRVDPRAPVSSNTKLVYFLLYGESVNIEFWLRRLDVRGHIKAKVKLSLCCFLY